MILGMHRSGTSLVSQWLHQCGLHLGDDLVPADTGNADGHFEDADFVRLHQQLLAKRRLDRNGYVQQELSRFSNAEYAAIEQLLNQKQARMQWAWKDPRTTLFLPLYRTALPQACCLVVVRGYNEVVNSLVLRDYKIQERNYARKKGLSKWKWKLLKRMTLEQHFAQHTEDYLRTWICYAEELLGHVATLPARQVLFLHYEDLLEHDRRYFDYFCNRWGLQLQWHPFSSVFKPGMLSEVRNISSYVRDAKLLQMADALHLELSLQAGKSLDAITPVHK